MSKLRNNWKPPHDEYSLPEGCMTMNRTQTIAAAKAAGLAVEKVNSFSRSTVDAKMNGNVRVMFQFTREMSQRGPFTLYRIGVMPLPIFCEEYGRKRQVVPGLKAAELKAMKKVSSMFPGVEVVGRGCTGWTLLPTGEIRR